MVQLLPRAFVWRRLHSLMGLWLAAFLFIHLLSNSQAALWVGDDGSGFVKAANDIQALPYIHALEILLLAIPFAIHIFWGVKYLFTAEPNSFVTDGTTPALPEYRRNHAYTWQRITSWALIVLITLHVLHMRFLEAPTAVREGSEKYYMVRVQEDPGIRSLSERLDVKLYNANQVGRQEGAQGRQSWLNALQSIPLEENQLIAESKNFGTAELLMVRESFKNPMLIILYTMLVLSACFHAYNGLWTFAIKWGITLSKAAQRLMLKLAWFLIIFISFLGLAAIWGTYLINLRY